MSNEHNAETAELTLADRIMKLQAGIISVCTDGSGSPIDEATYRRLRSELVNSQNLKDKVPDFVRTCRDQQQTRSLMQEKGGYKARRSYIYEAFAPLLDFVEGIGNLQASANEVAEPKKQELSDRPTAFISYAWEDDTHNKWVHDFATKLRSEDGVNVTLDKWDAVPGDQLPAFMERAISSNSFVLVICTPKYKAKSDARQGGVGYEGDIMTAEAYTSRNDRKFIPILRKGERTTANPSWLLGKYGVDLRGEPYSDSQYDDLLTTIHGFREQAPPIGPIPERLRNSPVRLAVETNTKFEPIKITGVVVDEVSTPKNDGTSGSALYAVPFKLSRRPSAEWARLFVETWNHPPSWTTMHRPGIASISADRAILDGTTLEEIERYHRETLKLVVKTVNEQIQAHEMKKQQQDQQNKEMESQHRQSVEDIASRLKFDD